MRTENEIGATACRLQNALRVLSDRYDVPLTGTAVSAEQICYMAMGALAMAQFSMGLDGENLMNLLQAMERHVVEAN